MLTAPNLDFLQVDSPLVALHRQGHAGRRVEARKARRATSSPGSAIGYRRVWVARTPAHVVQVDLRRQGLRVSVALTEWGIGGREPWARFIARTRPTAAITGTYFDVASSVPVGSLVISGIPVNRGRVCTALGINRAGEAAILSCRGGMSRDWRQYDSLIHAGPRLLSRGRMTLDPRAEGFRDRRIYERKPRAAVGLTRSGKLLLVAVTRPIYLRQLAAVMRGLGARDAMALDGGSSAGLYYRGHSYVVPRRCLTNLLVIYDTEAHYLRAAKQLAPAVREVLVHKTRT
jgi:Phosphodiester glycosidase